MQDIYQASLEGRLGVVGESVAMDVLNMDDNAATSGVIDAS